MTHLSNQDETELQNDNFDQLYTFHFQRALVRSGASFGMWLFAFFSFLFGIIKADNFTGISISVTLVVLMNPPTLWVLKRGYSRNLYTYLPRLIDGLEIFAFTAIIYSLGGIEATYLIPIYATLIIYDGVVSHQRTPFITAGACGAAFGLMVVIEYVGLIPHLNVNIDYYLPLENQLMIVLVVFGLLFVVALISSHTADLLKMNRDRLHQQNEALRLAKTAADKASKAKSNFLANMSHELRTPLNHIIGFTELVVDKNFGDLNEVQEEYLNDVLHSGTHLLSLLNDILVLARMEERELELEPSDVDLRMLLENSLTMIKEKALKHGIKLLIDMDGIPETIRADERKLNQIMYNLLSNAVKYTPEGGEIRLTANKAAGSESRVGAERKSRFAGVTGSEHALDENVGHSKGQAMRNMQCATGDFIEISVTDTGIGLQQQDLARIFTPFEQVDNSASRRFQGTGLGLSLTRNLVELHGGRIWVESEGEGKGSRFNFVIPVTIKRGC